MTNFRNWLEKALKIRPSSTHARQKLIKLLVELEAPKETIALHQKYLRFYQKVIARRNAPPPKGKPKPKRRKAGPGR